MLRGSLKRKLEESQLEDSEPGVYSSLLRGAPPPFSAHFPRLLLSPALSSWRPFLPKKGTPYVEGPHQERREVEKGAGNPRVLPLFLSTGHTPAFSAPFYHGKARSVARGGWRSECHEWW